MNAGAPPCSQCKRPSGALWAEGTAAAEIWGELDRHDRQYGPLDGSPLALPLASVRAAATDYGYGLEMQKLVLALEEKVLEMKLAEHAKRARRSGRGKTK
ncbi:MAG: hypothetical protein LBV80_10945 [Deltaproteobacteria bacterium]|nr:hypothetical protein [Deltaproteobacteria bacterium]